MLRQQPRYRVIGWMFASWLCLAPVWADAESGGEADYDQLLAQWQQQVVELQQLRDLLKNVAGDERTSVLKKYAAALKNGELLIEAFTRAAESRLATRRDADSEEAKFLQARVRDLSALDKFESVARLSQMLIANDVTSREIYEVGALSNFMTNDLDRTADYLQRAEKFGALSEGTQRIKEGLSEYRDNWSAELVVRRAEAETDDLPRVRMTTSKGDIVVELFENEAPKTVGNFVHLVEQGYYDGQSFFFVLKKLLAQAGCPNGDGSGGPGYTIPTECDRPDFRRHFRGSISMFREEDANSAGSQFFLSFAPDMRNPSGNYQFNSKYTVFGRMIEGVDVLAKLKRRDPRNPDAPTPDKIITAVVERKRDHDYTPTKNGQ